MTNRDRLNGMSIQELVYFYAYYVECLCCPVMDSEMCYSGENCSESWKRWLESEVKECQ